MLSFGVVKGWFGQSMGRSFLGNVAAITSGSYLMNASSGAKRATLVFGWLGWPAGQEISRTLEMTFNRLRRCRCGTGSIWNRPLRKVVEGAARRWWDGIKDRLRRWRCAPGRDPSQARDRLGRPLRREVEGRHGACIGRPGPGRHTIDRTRVGQIRYAISGGTAPTNWGWKAHRHHGGGQDDRLKAVALRARPTPAPSASLRV